MRELVFVLILVNFCIPCISAYRYCINKNDIEVNHILLFSTGFMYYMVLPILVGYFGVYAQVPAMPLWYGYFNNISNQTLIIYLISIAAIYLAFLGGTLVSEKVSLNSYRLTEKLSLKLFKGKVYIDSNTSLIAATTILIIIGTIIAPFIFKHRNEFFRGYLAEVALDPSKGSFVAYSLVLLSLAFIYAVDTENLHEFKLHRLLNTRFFIAYFFVAVLIISLGGRLYFVTSLIMIFVYRTVYHKKIKLSRLIIIFLVGIISMGIIGVLRDGSSVTGLSKITFNIAAEPVFTAFSLVSFLEAGKIELLNFPKFLLGDFINLVPSAILPNKSQFLLNPNNFNYVIAAPLGARNVFTSLCINFGVIGSLVFMFSFSFFINKLKLGVNSKWKKVCYIMVSGCLIFTFFRDEFSLSLIKNIFEFSIVAPILLYFLTRKINLKAILNKEKDQAK